MHHRGRNWSTLRTVGVYALFGVAWILLSDRILFATVQDERIRSAVSEMKGILFVMLSALLIYVLLAADARALRTSERDVEDRQHRLEQALRIGRTAAWEWRLVDRTFRISGNAADVLSVDPEHLASGTAGLREIIDAQDLARAEAEMREAMRQRKQYEGLLHYTDRDGVRRCMEARGSGVPEGAAEPEAMLGTVTDVTDRVALEEAVRALNAGLEQKVSAQTAMLQEANQELEAFAHSVAHDLRAPLRSVAGYAMALEEDAGDKLDAECRDYISRMRRAVERMNALIDGLLGLSRVNRAELSLSELDISALATQALDELAQREPHRDVDATVEPDLKANGDPRLVKTLVENLVGNAWKYTGKQKTALIKVQSVEGGGFSVSDNGVGFDMKHANAIFEPFERLHGPADFPGSGIGLATVRRIVRRHGWTIDFYAEPDKGATFTVRYQA